MSNSNASIQDHNPATHTATAAPMAIRYATAEQVARVYQCSPSSIRRRAKAGEIEAVRLGRLVRYPIPASLVG